MNSQERHEQRYFRRKLKRELKKYELRCSYDDFDKIFTFENMWTSYKKSLKNVSWKGSVQRYDINAIYNINSDLRKLYNGQFKITNTNEFDINERGKVRHIRSVGIAERVVQKCLCDYSLVPLLKRSFIYDNGASIKNKGVSFTRNRLKYHLMDFLKHNNTGYVLTFDFKKYFESIPHELILKILHEYYSDQRIIDLIMVFVKFQNKENHGIDLGSQVSQILALAAANKLDHYIKEVLGYKYYARYMDDGYIICENKDKLNQCMNDIISYTKELGLVINIKKTRIVKLSKGFVFLKNRYIVDNKKIIIIPTKSGTVRMRRKLKRFAIKLENNEMTYDDILQSYNAWLSHLKGTKCYRTKQTMNKLFDGLFIKSYVHIRCNN